jgi:hypothetical protein
MQHSSTLALQQKTCQKDPLLKYAMHAAACLCPNGLAAHLKRSHAFRNENFPVEKKKEEKAMLNQE